jgi:hypothetical protein
MVNGLEAIAGIIFWDHRETAGEGVWTGDVATIGRKGSFFGMLFKD